MAKTDGSKANILITKKTRQYYQSQSLTASGETE
jgi:hypothetical protein